MIWKVEKINIKEKFTKPDCIKKCFILENSIYKNACITNNIYKKEVGILAFFILKIFLEQQQH